MSDYNNMSREPIDEQMREFLNSLPAKAIDFGVPRAPKYCVKTIEYDCPGLKPGAEPCIYYARPKEKKEWCCHPMTGSRLWLVDFMAKCPGRKERGESGEVS